MGQFLPVDFPVIFLILIINKQTMLSPIPPSNLEKQSLHAHSIAPSKDQAKKKWYTVAIVVGVLCLAALTFATLNLLYSSGIQPHALQGLASICKELNQPTYWGLIVGALTIASVVCIGWGGYKIHQCRKITQKNDSQSTSSQPSSELTGEVTQDSSQRSTESNDAQDEEEIERQRELEMADLQKELEQWVAECPDGFEKEQRNACAYQIAASFKRQSSHLELNCCRLTSLPSAISRFTHLKTLDLSYNDLTEFPDAICQLTDLVELNINNNAIVSLPPAIKKLTKLRILNIRAIRLNSLYDLPPPAQYLTSLPAEIGQLSNLTDLDLRFHQLTSLPNAILELPSRCRIDISGNPLSNQIMQNLRRVTQAQGYTGPTIHYAMRENGVEIRTLGELLNELSESTGMQPLKLDNLYRTQKEEQSLTNWLSRVSLISDYKHKRQELARIIYQVLEKAEKEAPFRDVFWNCIAHAHETCGDRMALSVIYLDLQFKISESLKKGDLAALAYLIGHGTYALDKLEKIAAYKVSTLKFVDEIEVYLAYPIKLTKELHLPIPMDTMLHFGCSEVTDQDLEEAAKVIKGELSDKQIYYEFLANDTTWQEALQKTQTEKFNRIKNKRETAADTESPNYTAIENEFKKELVALTKEVLTGVKFSPFQQ